MKYVYDEFDWKEFLLIIILFSAADVVSETVWIGLKEKRWMNGDDFTNVLGIFGSLSNDFLKKPYGRIKNNLLDDHDGEPRHDHMFLCEILMA